MVAYADTSFLYSLYGHDANSAQARTMGNGLKVPLAFTPLQRHELRNAFRLALFRKVMTLERCQAVLDEVEAALDDVNLQRFLGLVDEFRDEAQLLIVTHQKRTMESADALYGVTMVPGSSSKVVSQRVKRNEGVTTS